MGDNSTHRGECWQCGYCGVTHEGVRNKVTVYNFEDWYPEPTYVEVPEGAFGAQLHQVLGEFVANSLSPTTQVDCPESSGGCGPVDEEDTYAFDDGWECDDCNEIHESEAEAESCCASSREHRQQWQMREQQTKERMLEEAKRLLQNSGYVVSQPQYEPRPAVLDQIHVNAPSSWGSVD